MFGYDHHYLSPGCITSTGWQRACKGEVRSVLKFLLARIVFYRQYWSANCFWNSWLELSGVFNLTWKLDIWNILRKASTWISRQTANLNNVLRWTQQIAKPPRSRGLDWRTQLNPGSGLSDSGISTWVTRHNCRIARFLQYDPS